MPVLRDQALRAGLCLAVLGGIAPETGALDRAMSAAAPPALAGPVVPPPKRPRGCMVSERSFSNTTPVAIVDQAVVTSTINVVGLRGYVLDVAVFTDIAHAAAADLDITLQSPWGGVVTLTTDNGGDHDDVFRGTAWHDGADDPVSDHVFQNLVTATPLSPEEALGAFRFVWPEGAWTLSISDDSAADTGTLHSWSLLIRTVPWPGVRAAGLSNGTAVPIPDGGTATSTISFDPSVALIYASRLFVNTSIGHSTSAAELDITLASPLGKTATLSTDNGEGYGYPFFSVVWTEEANPGGQVPYTTNYGMVTDHPYDGSAPGQLTPEEPLSLFMGEDYRGTWTLSITDDTPGGGTGTLHSWALTLEELVCGGSGDFDSWFTQDLVLRNVNTGAHSIWFMFGTSLWYENSITPQAPPGVRVVGSNAFIGGRPDLVLRNDTTGQIEFWAMNGASRVGDPVPLTGAPPLPTHWTPVATGDFNHDGSNDLLFRDTASQDLLIWTLGENGALSTEKSGEIVPSPSQAVHANWSVVAALDFDHDNNRDLLWYNSSSGKIVVWFMDQNVVRTSGSFTSPPSAGDNNWKVVAAGDYGPPTYGDKNHDIVWRNENSGKFVVWHLDGNRPSSRIAGTFTNPDSPSPPLAYTIVAPR